METNTTNTPAPAKSKIAYRVLAIFLGAFGIHNFYAGRKKRGFIELGIVLVLIIVASVIAPSEITTLEQLKATKRIITLLRMIPWIWIIIDLCKVKTDGKGVPFA